MRLTLRTLLAYIDNILDPADSQTISKKVEESEFATNLMHRTREVTRRLRLGAPRLDGRGLALDPNTVAEYLDNTLPSERVPDFEKVCLESDMHLAEVASAHQILALVLGEPAEVDVRLRERMYRLASQPVASTVGAKARVSDTPIPVASRTPSPEMAAALSAEVAEANERRQRSKPEVPEYLREPPRPRRSRAGLLTAFGLAILFCAAAAAAMNFEELLAKFGLQPIGPPPGSGQLAQNTELQQPAGPAVAGSQPTTVAGAPATAGGTVSSAVGGSGTGGPATVPPAVPIATAPAIPAAQPTAPVATTAATVVPPVAVPPSQAPQSPVGPVSTPVPGTPTEPAVPPTGSVAGTATGPSAPPAMVPGVASGAADTTVPVGGVAPPLGSVAATSGTPAGVATPGGVAPAPASVGAGAAPVPGPVPAAVAPVKPTVVEGVGRFMEGDLLVRFNPTDGLWHRVPARTTVNSGDRLMALPTFLIALTLSTGVNIDMLGGTEVVLLPPDARGVLGVEVLSGRIVLLSAGTASVAVRVIAGGRESALLLSDANSTAAVEVRHLRIEGTDPEREPAVINAELYVTTGTVQWSNSGAAPETIPGPARRLLAGGDAISPLNETPSLPAWVTATDDRTPMQKRASGDLPKALPTDRPLTLGLKELAGDRRIETSLLAVQCLAAIGEYDTLVTALRDPNQKAVWNDEVESLRLAIARSPMQASSVHQAFIRHYGPRGSELFRMLWGYSPEQVAADAGAQLVKYLDHEDLEYRVLSFSALTRLAGGATHFYRPEFPAARRQQYIVQWRQRLESGRLAPKPKAGP